MNYWEFKDKYIGQYVDVDYYPKEWPYQCFDLAQLYFQEVLNVPDYVLAGCGVVKNMIEWDWKYDQLMEYFDEIDTHAMETGDVSIWTQGDAGHIAIYNDYDGVNCWYFSQNPNPCDVIPINMEGHHAFRRKKETPPLPPITPTVDRNENVNQIKVIVPELNVRTQPVPSSDSLGFAPQGYYNYYEKVENEGYLWYRIADNQWVANNGEWVEEYAAKPQEKYIKLEDYIKEYGYVIDIQRLYYKK